MAVQNKLFTGGVIPKTTAISKVKLNREYLISQTVAEDLNTYNYFGIFKSYNDLYKTEYNSEGNEVFDGKTGPGTPAVRSIFNRAGGVVIGTDNRPSKDILNSEPSELRTNASGWRISNNVPLMDSPENRRRIRKHSGCSIKELVQQSQQGLLGRAIYSYADFMYCKYLGKMPNNYLITLRRFPIPPGDFISTVGEYKDALDAGKNLGMQQIGCMVTWMGTPGNEMANILKYSVTMPYTEKQSAWQDAGSDADSNSKLFNSIAAAFDPTYRQQYISGHGGEAYNKYIGKFFNVDNGPYPATGVRDENKIYGPIDKVKKTYMRSDEGINFDQKITLTFDYELRAYNGINTRQAMLDLLSNILNVTYTTGGFWGGGYKGGGMHQNSIFNNLQIFKVKGGFTEFMDAFAQDYSTVTEAARTKIEANGGILQTLKMALNALGGMILGGALNKLGRPQRAFANSLLSEQPVGMWHLTVGNPHHPIISIGNMILKNTTIQHYGPLGLDDFPTGIRVICELDRGKPRDIREIEKMYMHGNDRIYFTMGPKVIEMYKQAVQYKSRDKSQAKTMNSQSQQEIPTTTGGDTQTAIIGNSLENNDATMADLKGKHIQTPPKDTTDYVAIAEKALDGMTGKDLENVQSLMQKWFGEIDTYSIFFAAAEQGDGATKKKPSTTDEGSDDNKKDKKQT